MELFEIYDQFNFILFMEYILTNVNAALDRFHCGLRLNLRPSAEDGKHNDERVGCCH